MSTSFPERSYRKITNNLFETPPNWRDLDDDDDACDADPHRDGMPDFLDEFCLDDEEPMPEEGDFWIEPEDPD